MEKYKKVNEIRFLPCSKKDSSFGNSQSAKNFLINVLNKRGGVFYFPSSHMKCDGDTLVLFQYNGELIASAILTEIVKKECTDEYGALYSGYYLFDMTTMKWFDTPITAKDISKIDVSFTKFSQAKRKMNIELLNDIIQLIDKAVLSNM